MLTVALAACTGTPGGGTTEQEDDGGGARAPRDVGSDSSGDDGGAEGDVTPDGQPTTGDAGGGDAPAGDGAHDSVDSDLGGFTDEPCELVAPDDSLEQSDCDGVDNDCDGSVDEGCDCTVPGRTRECGPNLIVGACRNGIQICDDEHTWSDCEGAVWPTEEDVCNALDDDCDGQVNEGWVEKCRCDTTVTAAFSCSGDEMVACPHIGEGVATVDMPALTERCPFGIDDNGDMRDDFFVARAEQTVPLSLPEGIDLCALEISVTTEEFYFDDHLLFLFNDFVLVSDLAFQEFLPERDGLAIYEWESISGLEHTSVADGPRCIAGAVECNVPGTQSTGSVALSFEEETNRRLLADAATSGRYEFTAVVTGDDNPEIDCQHSGLPLEVRYRYR